MNHAIIVALTEPIHLLAVRISLDPIFAALATEALLALDIATLDLSDLTHGVHGLGHPCSRLALDKEAAGAIRLDDVLRAVDGAVLGGRDEHGAVPALVVGGGFVEVED